MKKICCYLVCLVFLLVGCNDSLEHKYKTADRVVLSSSLSQSRIQPDFDNLILWSDVVVECTVLADGIEMNTIGSAYSPSLPYTIYTMKKIEVLHGEMDKSVFNVHILGAVNTMVTKPLKNDHLILFLKYGAAEDAYGLVDYEYSMFAVNPNNRMYAFGNTETFTIYDNKTKEYFHSVINQKYADISDLIVMHPEAARNPGSVAEKTINEEVELETK